MTTESPHDLFFMILGSQPVFLNELDEHVFQLH